MKSGVFSRRENIPTNIQCSCFPAKTFFSSETDDEDISGGARGIITREAGIKFVPKSPVRTMKKKNRKVKAS